MNIFGLLFTAIDAWLLMALPRRWAPIAFLAGAVCMTVGQQLQMGPFSFTVIRLLVAVGVLRVIARGERIAGGFMPLDKIMCLWAAWAVFSSIFHEAPTTALVAMLGMSYDRLGIYFLMRVFVQDVDDVLNITKAILIILIPLALEMIREKMTGENAFALFGYVPAMDAVRGGAIRAQGPFSHSILAGTVGAVCMPLALLFWNRRRSLALVGLIVNAVIVGTSASSGPILTVTAIAAGLAMWRFRLHMRMVRWGAALALIVLNLVMSDPVYFLLARIDFTGSSTGWHRAALIDSAIKHMDEWWLGGTDYTRHWMPTGVYWSQDHADITNHYIKMGVWGGLPLLLLFAGTLCVAFAAVGDTVRRIGNRPTETSFIMWMLGAILFGHVMSFLAVSYYDQTIVFYYYLLAAIASLHAVTSKKPARRERQAVSREPLAEIGGKHE